MRQRQLHRCMSQRHCAGGGAATQSAGTRSAAHLKVDCKVDRMASSFATIVVLGPITHDWLQAGRQGSPHISSRGLRCNVELETCWHAAADACALRPRRASRGGHGRAASRQAAANRQAGGRMGRQAGGRAGAHVLASCTVFLLVQMMGMSSSFTAGQARQGRQGMIKAHLELVAGGDEGALSLQGRQGRAGNQKRMQTGKRGRRGPGSNRKAGTALPAVGSCR